MDSHTLTTILIALVSALILGLFTIVWFSVRRFVDHVDGLQDSMDSLKQAIDGWATQFVTRAQLKADLAELRKDTALGRRQMDHCLSPACPFEQADPNT